MLKRVTIQNFRSCRDTSLQNLSSIVALIGRNGAGKTNILRAINWLANMATSLEYGMESLRIYSLEDFPCRVGIEAEIAGRTYVYELERSYRTVPAKGQPGMALEVKLKETLQERANDGTLRMILERDGQEVRSSLRNGRIQINPWAGSLTALTSVLPPNEPIVQEIRPVLRFLSSVRYYPIDEPCEPESPLSSSFIHEKEYQDWLAKYKETGNPGESAPMRLLHMSLAMPDKFEQLKSLLGPDGLDLIHTVTVSKYPPREDRVSAEAPAPPPFYILRFSPTQCVNGTQFGFTYGDLSSGTRRILTFLVSLLFDASEVMLVEHPEDGIHTALVRKLVALLKSIVGQTQIILSSHSSTILNELDPNQIRMVTMESCQTHVRPLGRKEIKAATDYMAEDGTLSEFLELVEG